MSGIFITFNNGYYKGCENENLEKIIQLELKLQSVLAYGYRINK